MLFFRYFLSLIECLLMSKYTNQQKENLVYDKIQKLFNASFYSVRKVVGYVRFCLLRYYFATNHNDLSKEWFGNIGP